MEIKTIMSRAWEIKKEADRKTRNIKYNVNDFSPLSRAEKAIFGECLKLAWEEVRRAAVLAQKLKIDISVAALLAAHETELKEHAVWRIWSNYGKVRAYYTVPSYSRYQNNKGLFLAIA